jgi:hypothetical protein
MRRQRPLIELTRTDLYRGERFEGRHVAFAQLCRTEPRLAVLLVEACVSDRRWYGVGGIRDDLGLLVGDGAKNRSMRGSYSYDIAYETLLESMPQERW